MARANSVGNPDRASTSGLSGESYAIEVLRHVSLRLLLR